MGVLREEGGRGYCKEGRRRGGIRGNNNNKATRLRVGVQIAACFWLV